ncbi:MAG: DUF3553 domain-containing protein [Phycisphaerales bacterium]|nr:DUF3553 domain-containing protein [Phycisphaerales bacterium]
MPDLEATNADTQLLAGLTEPQRQAVTTTEGPLLVLAAAGSGKTRVITRRIAYLIRMGIPPWQVLALTFTNKAAAEMAQRVRTLLDDAAVDARGLTVATFHSLCARLLRRYADELGIEGLNHNYSIFDTDAQLSAMKKAIAKLDLSTANFQPRAMLSRVSNFKNRLIDVQAASALGGNFFDRHAARIYAAYDEELRASNAVDFDDLLMLTAQLLRDREDITAQLQQRFAYLLIDEYQDTNHAQFQIASQLVAAHKNICVVGDPDQSIYAWRGADISNILEFEAQYPNASVVTLGRNFRSTTYILQAADQLIRNNKRRKHKDLYTDREGGELPQVTLCRNEHHEASMVMDHFQRLRDEQDMQWKDMAVFYRINALSRVMEEELRRAGVPYIIARGTAFYERKEVRDALAYLRLLCNERDEVSLRRIVNVPARGISKMTLDCLDRFAIHVRISLRDAMQRVDQAPGLKPKAVAAVQRFGVMTATWQRRASEQPACSADSVEHDAEAFAEFVDDVISESGLEAYYRKAGVGEEEAQRLENLRELVSSASDFAFQWMAMDPGEAVGEVPGDAVQPHDATLLDLLRAWLEQVSLVADVDALDPSVGAVSLMTLHAAKGLEFPAVAMIGLEDGLLPHARSRESDDALEEERRLCFVGITRAMERLLITCASQRTIRGVPERTIPSRFLMELPRDATVFSDQSAFDDADDELDACDDQPMRGTRFRRGSMVRHPQFGIGRVQGTVPGGYVKVAFADAGIKTLATRYARLESVQ